MAMTSSVVNFIDLTKKVETQSLAPKAAAPKQLSMSSAADRAASATSQPQRLEVPQEITRDLGETPSPANTPNVHSKPYIALEGELLLAAQPAPRVSPCSAMAPNHGGRSKNDLGGTGGRLNMTQHATEVRENDVIEIQDFSQTFTNHREGLREQVQAGNAINQ